MTTPGDRHPGRTSLGCRAYRCLALVLVESPDVTGRWLQVDGITDAPGTHIFRVAAIGVIKVVLSLCIGTAYRHVAQLTSHNFPHRDERIAELISCRSRGEKTAESMGISRSTTNRLHSDINIRLKRNCSGR